MCFLLFVCFIARNLGWKEHYDKKYYSRDDEAHRFLVFVDNWKKINDHNKDADNGKHSHWLEVNQFADMTSDEFKFHVHGHHDSCLAEVDKSNNVQLKTFVAYNGYDDIPESIDWTNVNGTSYVTPVKNQGHCGSCWSFSTTGMY